MHYNLPASSCSRFLEAPRAALKKPTMAHGPNLSIYASLRVIFSTFVRDSC